MSERDRVLDGGLRGADRANEKDAILVCGAVIKQYIAASMFPPCAT